MSEQNTWLENMLLILRKADALDKLERMRKDCTIYFGTFDKKLADHFDWPSDENQSLLDAIEAAEEGE